MAVGTRPDCIDEAILELLVSFTDDYDVWLELGLQSAHNETLGRIQRGHRVESFLQAVKLASATPLSICAHVILGLPGEDHQKMMATAQLLASLPIHGVKIHHCQVIRGTPLAEQYLADEYEPLAYAQYLQYVCDFLEYLPWPVTIQRLLGEAPKNLILAPLWGIKKDTVLKHIDQELDRRQSIQGTKS